MNGLLDSYYTMPGAYTGNSSNPVQTLGGSIGFNVGSEVFRVQAGITGLLLASVVVLLLLHRGGHRFSTRV